MPAVDTAEAQAMPTATMTKRVSCSGTLPDHQPWSANHTVKKPIPIINHERIPINRWFFVPTNIAKAATTRRSQVTELSVKLPVFKLKIPLVPSSPFCHASNPNNEFKGLPVKRSISKGRCKNAAVAIDIRKDLINRCMPTIDPERKLPRKKAAKRSKAGSKNIGSKAIPMANNKPVNKPFVNCVRSFIPGPISPPIDP